MTAERVAYISSRLKGYSWKRKLLNLPCYIPENKNPEDFKSIIEKLYDTIEELKKENAEIKNRLNKLENNTKIGKKYI